MDESKTREYIVNRLPALKGICILGVILIHAIDPTRIKPEAWITATAWLVNSLPRFAVPLFFVFSGFSLSLSPRNDQALRFYRRTLKYLLVPYVIYSLAYSLPLLWQAEDWPWLVARGLPEGSAYYHLWFIPALLRAFVLHPFLIRYYRTLRHPEPLVLTGLLAPIFWPSLLLSLQRDFPAASVAIGWMLGSSTNWSMAFPTYLGFFILGYYLLQHAEEVHNVERRRVGIASLLVWTAAASGMAALAIGRSLEHADQIRSLLVICLTIAACPAILAFVTALRTAGPIYRHLHSFGLYSYGVYYLHPAWLYVLRRAFVRAVGIQFEDPFLYPLLFVVVSVATLQTVRLIARSPVGKYLT